MKQFNKIKTYIIAIILAIICTPINLQNNNSYATTKTINKPMLVIIIDDFGGYDQSGVHTMLSIREPLTCAIMPNLENTTSNALLALDSGKEVIVHMPMQAHVNIPHHWYGPEFIENYDNKDNVYKKLDNAFESVPGAKGFNVHIGSGVCQHENVLSYIYDYSIDKNLPFVDSRTHLNTLSDKVAKSKNIVYLGRDEFLEPDGNKSYQNVKKHLMIGAYLAKEKGYAIVIGHVGSHGGENTSKAIKDSIDEIKNLGVEIVPLSKLHNQLNNNFTKQTICN